MNVLDEIYSAGFTAYLYGFGAVDSWLNDKRTESFNHILTTAGTTDLAKLFDNLRFPGVELADAALDENDKTWYFKCVDSLDEYSPSFKLLKFFRNCKSRVFSDPGGMYPLLNEIRKGTIALEHLESGLLTDAALILAKYFPAAIKLSDVFSASLEESHTLNNEEQRVLLCELVTSPNPGLGFELLKQGGFVTKYWKELADLELADHSKEFHPEGNAWEHTMETFCHRKAASRSWETRDLRLSLGLLLHDIGKPIAISDGNHRFEGHAELGEAQTRRFLGRLGFNASLITDVCFLVRNHMLPAALPRLPLFRTSQIMSSPLFPLLMELYRCDESSSFKGLDGYYESSAVYQQFLRNRRNPYHSSDGKLLNNKQISSTVRV